MRHAASPLRGGARLRAKRSRAGGGCSMSRFGDAMHRNPPWLAPAAGDTKRSAGEPVGVLFDPRQLSLFARSRENCPGNAIGIAEYFLVPKSQHAKTEFRQGGIPDQVARIFRVLTTIGLDDEPGVEADEIDNKSPDGMLAAKTQAFELFAAQHQPKARLGDRWFTAHRFSQNRDVRQVSFAASCPLGSSEAGCVQVCKERISPLLRFLAFSLRLSHRNRFLPLKGGDRRPCLVAYPFASTKLSSTRFCPALSKSMVSLLPSMPAMMP